MNFLEYCRNQAFWLMDAAKGSRVKKALTSIKKIESNRHNGSVLQLHQEAALAGLLKYVLETVPYYKGKHFAKLEDFPVTNKNLYRSNYDAFISSHYKKEDLVQMHTSGSTGTPFTCYQDGGKKKHVNAETLFYNGLVGFEIGRRIIYLRSCAGDYSKSKLVQFIQNIDVLDCGNLSDEGIAQKLEFIKRRSKQCGALLMGYSTTFDIFRRYFEKYGYDKAKGCNVYGIVSGSTMLYDDTRNSLEKAFGCKCVSRYANEENGFLGQDSDENNVFLMNETDYYFEILKIGSDEQAQIGEIGRIVVTDLYNYGMPMVRYDTGDVGAWVETKHNGTAVKAIGNFGGRVVDLVYDCENVPVSPHEISNIMKKYQGVNQYQFIQRDTGVYLMKINMFDASLDEGALLKDVKDKFGQHAQVTFEYCKEIPVLASGKRRYVVNEMVKK